MNDSFELLHEMPQNSKPGPVQDPYVNLKTEFCKLWTNINTNESLQYLKDCDSLKYEKCRRKMEKITSMEEFLQYLESINKLSVNNVEKLNTLVKLVTMNEKLAPRIVMVDLMPKINKLVNEYVVPSNSCTCSCKPNAKPKKLLKISYDLVPLKKSPKTTSKCQLLAIPQQNKQDVGGLREQDLQCVYDNLSSEYLDFLRGLEKLTEGDINRFRRNCRGDRNAHFRSCLEYYWKKAGGSRDDIIRALNNCGRGDVIREILRITI